MDRSIEQEILERIVRIETKIDGYNGLREKVDTTHGMTVKNTDDIKDMKDNLKWLWRTIAGALILGFIAAFIKWGAM